MAGGPQIYNLGQQAPSWLESFKLGADSAQVISNIRFNWAEENRLRDKQTFEMMTGIVDSLAPHMNLGTRDAWKLIADSGILGNLTAKYNSNIDPNLFNSTFRRALDDEATMTVPDLYKKALSEVVRNPQVVGGMPQTQTQQIPQEQPQNQQMINQQEGGTVPAPNQPIQQEPTAQYQNVPLRSQTQVQTGTEETPVVEKVPDYSPTSVDTKTEDVNAPVYDTAPGEVSPYVEMPEEQKRGIYTQRLIEYFKSQGMDQAQAEAEAKKWVSEGRVTAEGVNFEGTEYQKFTTKPKTSIVEKTIETPVYTTAFKDIGEFTMTTDAESGVPEATLKLKEGTQLWTAVDGMVNQLITEEDKTGTFPSTESDNTPTKYWMQKIATDERNLEKLSEVSGISVNELKAMNQTKSRDGVRSNALEDLYAKHANEIELNIQFIPGSNTWRDVFGDPEMVPGKRDVIVEQHKDLTAALEGNDIPTALKKQETIDNLVGEEQTFKNSLNKYEWMFGLLGGGDWIKGITPENVNAGLKMAFTEFVAGKELALQELSNVGRMNELLIQQEFARASIAATNAGNNFEQWAKTMEIQIKQGQLELGVNKWLTDQDNYLNEQTENQHDEWRAQKEDIYKRLLEIAEEAGVDFGNAKDYETLYNRNEEFKGLVSEYNKIDNLLTPRTTPEIYMKYLRENIPEGVADTESWIDQQMSNAKAMGMFESDAVVTSDYWNLRLPFMDFKIDQWAENITTVPGLQGIHPSPEGTVPQPTQETPSSTETTNQDKIRQQMGF